MRGCTGALHVVRGTVVQYLNLNGSHQANTLALPLMHYNPVFHERFNASSLCEDTTTRKHMSVPLPLHKHTYTLDTPPLLWATYSIALSSPHKHQWRDDGSCALLVCKPDCVSSCQE